MIMLVESGKLLNNIGLKLCKYTKIKKYCKYPLHFSEKVLKYN